MENSKRYTEQQFHSKVTTYSFVIMMAVVFIHTFNLEVYGITTNVLLNDSSRFVYWFESFAANLWGVAVPFFFMTSGFLFYRNFTWEKLFSKYKSRFFSVLIPYVLWCSIYYYYYVIVTRLPFVRSMMNGREITPFTLSTWISRLWAEEYFVFWFLKDLIVLIILSPIIFICLKNRGKCPVGLVVLIISFFIGRIVSWWPFRLTYIFGAYIGINHKDAPLKCARKYRCCAMCGVFLWLLQTILFTFDVIDWKMPILLVLICLWYAGDFYNFEKQPPWWMQISFFIYCLHDMILEVYEKIFLKLFGISAICALVDYILMPIATVITVVCIAAWLRRYLPRTWNVLTGARG